jgi:selenocysteine-specific elongation factor
MPLDLILGTAGHIDHGKTALVKALTGVDTDRLPEEKRRGITIELGFAELPLGPYRLGIVDVPGHERFVRNMLAGATGVDLALLVVAADESVKPQTREHLEILRLLDLTAGVIALTKCDLPEPDWIDLVEEEVRDFVAGTFLADAPLVRTSTVTGAGLDALRAALERAAARAVESARHRRGGPFRLAIDRAFSVAGHGTVVTGSVLSGRAAVGDELQIEPGGIHVRIRGLQNHGRPVEEVHRGQRAAVNLAGIHHGQLGLGQELAASGHLVPSQRLSVRLNLLASTPRVLKNRARVRLHVGTAERMARVVLLDRDALMPGDSAPAQVFLREPVVTTWGQPFVLRSESPVATIGGGQVLDSDAPKLRREQEQPLRQLADLQSDDPTTRAAAALYFTGWKPWQAHDLARTAGVSEWRAPGVSPGMASLPDVAHPRADARSSPENGIESVCESLVERGDLVPLSIPPGRTVAVHRLVLEETSQRIEAAIEKLHVKHPLESVFDRARLSSRFVHLRGGAAGGEAIVAAVLARMAAARRITLSERGVALAGRGPQLSPQQRDLLERIVEVFRAARFQPPAPKQVQTQVDRNQAAVPELIKLATTQGRLVAIAPDILLHVEIEQEMRTILASRLADGEGLTVSQIRELLDTTRKYAVPLCEYLDRIGFTRRQGDLRVRGGI